MKKVMLLLCLVGCMLLFTGCFPLLGMMLIGEAESESLSEPEHSSQEKNSSEISAICSDESSSEEKHQDGLGFLNDFTKYGYSTEQINGFRTVLNNVGIVEITDIEAKPVAYGMQVVKGVLYKDTTFGGGGKEVQVQFNIENGVIYLVAIYCPSYYTANQTPYLSGLTDRRADLYYDVEGGYLKKIDWEKRAVVDY